MTDAERKLWWHLRKLPMAGSHFRRQATIRPYFADFACHEKRLIVELDGGHHAYGEQATRDAARDAFLRENGYRVLRFWNNDVIENVEGVLTQIYELLGAVQMPPTPDPSPPLRRGRGTGSTGDT